MKTKSTFTLFAAGIVAMLACAKPAAAAANDDARPQAARDIRSSIRTDRAELHSAYAELNRDRADLHQLYRRGASRPEIIGKRQEIKDDYRRVSKERSEIRQGYDHLRAQRYGNGWRNENRSANHYGWNRHDNHRWGWERDRFARRERWDRGYRRH